MVAESDVFLALITKYYLEDIQSQNLRIITQIEQAKILNKPTILAICRELTEKEQREAENYFKEHNVIGEVFFERNEPKSIEEAFVKIKQILTEKGIE